jgi:diacylglycerol kinase
MNQPINIRKAIKSFRYAGVGIYSLFRYENNARIHLLAAFVVFFAGVYFRISNIEWCIIIIQIALVWAAEAFNTAIEKIADMISSTYHPTIKVIKDVAAAGVLMLAISAVFVAGFIFLPKVWEALQTIK